MNVAELIKELLKYDQALPVFLTYEGVFVVCDPERISVEELTRAHGGTKRPSLVLYAEDY